MECTACGSNRHERENCSIAQKHALMLAGIPPEHLFDYIIEADNIEEVIEGIQEIRDDNTD